MQKSPTKDIVMNTGTTHIAMDPDIFTRVNNAYLHALHELLQCMCNNVYATHIQLDTDEDIHIYMYHTFSGLE